MTTKFVQKKTATNKTAELVQNMIVSGEFAAGDLLPPQRELADRLSVSRSSLREALSLLEGLGFTRTEQGRGTFVVSTDEDSATASRNWKLSDQHSLLSVYEFRYYFEGAAIQLAAANATAAELKDLEKIQVDYEAAIRSMDLVAGADLDFRFHGKIMEMGGNSLFVAVYLLLAEYMKNSQLLPFARHNKLSQPLNEHRKIFEALQQRDADAAKFHMETHLMKAAHRVEIELPNTF